MADRLQARSALEGILRPGSGAGLALRERTGLGLASIQARRARTGELARLVRERFGVELPEGPKRVAAGEIAFVGTGPGKWLAIFEPGTDLDLAGVAAVVDQSDTYAVVHAEGPVAREMLQQRLPIDLHPRAFGPGDAAATSLGHIGVLLWQLDDAPSYEIAAPRSYAASFCHALLG
jgi:heterotetrameric sarcosine oxidase gamma subunit